MATTRLHAHFLEFLRLLNSHGARYLLVGGYAVNYYGYHRTTGDLDVLIAIEPDNAERVAAAVRAFGFPEATAELFLRAGKMTRMYPEPYRVEVLTRIGGVEFGECWDRRVDAIIEGEHVPLIDLDSLLKNKRAAGVRRDV